MFEMIQQFKKMLGHIDTWLEKADENSKSRKFDAGVLVNSRLAPDQFTLAQQIGSACDTAKLGASRLTGKEAPKHEDNQTTTEELRTRVKSVIAYLESFTKADFAESGTRKITTPRWEGKHMLGADYFREHVVPNFFFHTAHAYAILRHNGVPVGKRDYLGQMSMKD